MPTIKSYYEVWISSPRYHGDKPLIYESDISIENGSVVTVGLRRQVVLGIVNAQVKKPAFKTQSILKQIGKNPVPSSVFKLFGWLRSYYPAPSGVLIQLFLPSGIQQQARPTPGPSKIPILDDLPETPPPPEKKLPTLTPDQQSALQQIQASKKQEPILLHGDTGTGKTRVYIELAKEQIQNGRSVLILTPEIGLTPQLIKMLEVAFPDQIIGIHSALTSAQRRDAWLKILEAEEPLVVVGPRSALFTPLSNIGLIVVDEAHDTAYKQEQAPNYQTTRVAARLAQLEGARLVLGSATPLINDYFTFKAKGLPIVRMTRAATETAKLDLNKALPSPDRITSPTTSFSSLDVPSGTSTSDKTVFARADSPQEQTILHKSNEAGSVTKLIALQDKAHFSQSKWLSDDLIKEMRLRLQNKEQSLLFLNRRGTARIILCQSCGWQLLCPRCDLPLTYHGDTHLALCHTCGHSEQTPSNCPNCHGTEVIFKSIGTKLIVAEIKRLLPEARVQRFDGDNLKADRLEMHYETIESGAVDILVGTQILSKGLDLTRLSLVGIVVADTGLYIPDYTAEEKTFQMISQVSGRVGRGHLKGMLIIQTYHPESPIINAAITKNYEEFYKQQLHEREIFIFPPFCYLLKLSCKRATQQSAKKASEKLLLELQQKQLSLSIIGPSPAFHEKQQGKYHWQLIVKSRSRGKLLEIIKSLPANWTYDIDPTNLL
ncbi:primosomal protein N' [Candidatus Saccharibacteria bacterium]|nr:primosomal protein N' [Candidatus Saccharibacteria bacterium]